MDYFAIGSDYYFKLDYKNAILNYRQAFNRNKNKPELPYALWVVLVDNFGMAYGVTKDYGRAIDVFEYGIANAPDYPLFYYNLACTYAEKGDSKKAVSNLYKAYWRRDNNLPGEKIPNPLTDDSFTGMLDNKDFQKIAGMINEANR